MKKILLSITIACFSTVALCQNKIPVTDTVLLNKEQSIMILNVLEIANKGLKHSTEITAAELTYIQEVKNKVGLLLYNKYFNKDGTPKKQ